MLRRTSKAIMGLALTAALSVGLFTIPFTPSFAAEETNSIKVQLLSLNDWHGQLDKTTKVDLDGDGERETVVGKASYLATHIKNYEAKNENTLVIHAGDMIGGSPMISSIFQDEPTVAVMEAMGIDVGTAGNHEFDEGIAEYLRMVKGGEHPKGTKDYDGMNFPNIIANVYDKSTGELILAPYHIQEVAGTKIGFIGVATTSTPSNVKVDGNENLEVRDELEAINKYAQELVDKGIEAIVVLAHNPAEIVDGEMTGDIADWEKKGLHEEVDLIFAGHNHKSVNGFINDDVAVVQAWEYGYMFGAVNIEIDPTTNDIVREKTVSELVYNTQDVEEDPTVKAILDKYEGLIAPIKEEVVGESLYDYESNRYPLNDRAYSDHAIGNLIADSMVWAMDSDFALMNGGGVRAALDAGPITFGELYTIQPFQNMLQKFTVDGAGLRQILTNQISKYGLDYSISGFKYTYTYDHDARTGEIVDMMLPDGTPIKDDELYTVTTNDYSFKAKGMDKYAIGQTEMGDIDSDALKAYVKHIGKVDLKPEGRIMQVTDRFSDVALNHWANPYIFDLSFKGIIKGKTATTFDPKSNITRAEFAAMITRALGLEATEKAPFADTTNLDEVTQQEIAAAYEAGIIKGASATEFHPKKPITRAEMVTMLIRAYELQNGEAYEGQPNNFTDLAKLDAEMIFAINASAELGYVIGYGDVFKPFDHATRAEAAKVLSLYLLK